jgi:hypothetical protein
MEGDGDGVLHAESAEHDQRQAARGPEPPRGETVVDGQEGRRPAEGIGEAAPQLEVELDGETWVPVYRWPSHEVSSLGQYRTVKGRMLKLKPSNRPTDGPPFYQLITLCANGTQTTYSAHRMQLLSFAGPCCDRLRIFVDETGKLGPCPDGHESRHLNDIPDDNRWPENLAWGTPDQNAADKVRQARYRTAEARSRRSEHSRRSRRTQLAKRDEQRRRDVASSHRRYRPWRRRAVTERVIAGQRPITSAYRLATRDGGAGKPAKPVRAFGAAFPARLALTLRNKWRNR